MQNNEKTAGTKAPSFLERLDAAGRAHNSGVDLLRILSMFYIVTVHALNWGGVFEAAQPGTGAFACSALLRAITMTCVDIFALISGFVGYSEKKKPLRIAPLLQLYLQVVTCGVAAAAVFMIVRPDIVSLKDFVLPFIPITGNLYWYYTAYVGLFILMPLLNAALRSLPKRTLRVILIAMFAAFSVYTCVADRFKLQGGYTTFWLILLYIMGGILKKCEVGKKIKPWMAFAGIAVLTVVVWLWTLFGLELSVFGVEIKRNMLYPYTSPAIVAASALYVIGFSKLRCGRFVTRLAAFALPSVFAVYLINGNDLIHTYLIEGRFAHLVAGSPLVMVGTIVGFSAAFVAASILLDRVRVLVFDLLHVPQALASIDRAAHRLVEKYIPND